MKPVNEKRSFYRITDVVGLSCFPIDPGADDSAQHAGAADKALSGLLAEIDQEFNKATNALWLENPVFAQALGLLNRKLSIIAAHTLDEAGQEADSHEELTVSLSGSGIGFDTSEPFPQGARVRLLLALRPSNITLELTGVVVGCEPLQKTAQNRYWVRATFEEGNETAQERLIQHIVQRQCAQIRDSKPDSGS